MDTLPANLEGIKHKPCSLALELCIVYQSAYFSLFSKYSNYTYMTSNLKPLSEPNTCGNCFEVILTKLNVLFSWNGWIAKK